MLFSHRKLEVCSSHRSLILPAWTLHFPTAGIGTELLADREKSN